MQWGEPRPRHIRDPKTRAHEDSLQVIPAYYYVFSGSIVVFSVTKQLPLKVFQLSDTFPSEIFKTRKNKFYTSFRRKESEGEGEGE